MNDPWDPDYIDENVAKANAHPTRALILAELDRGILSPKQFAQRHDENVSNVSYHFRVLEKYDCVEVVEEKKVRGAIEHFYKATRRALFDGKDWERLPEPVRSRWSGKTMTHLLEASAEAMRAETFDARTERFLVWNTEDLDEKGWQEISDIYREAAGKTIAAEKRARRRVKESGEPGVRSTWAFLFFESPPKPEGQIEPA